MSDRPKSFAPMDVTLNPVPHCADRGHLNQRRGTTVGFCPLGVSSPSCAERSATSLPSSLRVDTKSCSVNNEDLSEIEGPFPVLPPSDNRELNDDEAPKEQAAATSAGFKPRRSSIIVIGSRSIIVTTLKVFESTSKASLLG